MLNQKNMTCLLHTVIVYMGLSMLIIASTVAANPDLPNDLTRLDLEALMNIEVTSVSKRPQQQRVAPAAVSVITGSDIQHWGVTNIPDALRMVPGLHVARTDANKWAISSRGFNGRFANKLLVLLDGRSVYTPLFAGVYWDALDTPLEDIDRIEVIRGPGGALWGANAVNGVINIITKSASKTQGTLLVAGIGDETRSATSLRYGSQTEGGIAYRLYAKYRDTDSGYSQGKSKDDAKFGQLGFRSDWELNSRDLLTLQGDYHNGRSGQQLTIPEDPAPTAISFNDDTELWGSNILLRWTRSIDDSSNLSLQLYYDHVDRDGPVLREDRDTFDLDFDFHQQWGNRHNLLWGLGYRRQKDSTSATSTFKLDPSSRDVNLYTAFIQDEISLVENQLQLTLGSKFEHNDFTGFEHQPNLRLAWTLDSDQTIWAAISRAVRTPARGEHDVRLRVLPPPGAPPVPVVVLGNRNFDSEELIAYELGYRLQKGQLWSSDLTTFINKYRNLRTFDPTVFPPPELGLPFDNRLAGTAWGIEWTGRLKVTRGWHLNAVYSYLDMDLDLKNGSQDSFSAGAEESSPQHQFSLWSSFYLTSVWKLDTTLRYVGDVNSPAPGADQYTELDVRLAWKPRSDLELSLNGRNLLHHHHSEFQPDFIQSEPTQVERSFFAQLKWQP